MSFSESGTASLKELMESNLVEAAAPQEEISSGTFSRLSEEERVLGGTGISAVSYFGKEGSLQGFV